MLTNRKRKLGILTFIFITLIVTTVLSYVSVDCADKGYVYTYNEMIEEEGFLYYVKTMDSGENQIYQLDLSNNKKKVLVSTTRSIVDMYTEQGHLYYVAANTQEDIITYSVSVTGGKPKKLCSGALKYIDHKQFFYTTYKNDSYRLYKYNRSTKKSTLIKKANSTFYYIKSIGTTLYFYENTDNYSKLKIYEMEASSTRIREVTTINFEEPIPDDYAILVSDIVEVNDNTYFQYGNYQGSGSFWYGTLVEYNKSTQTQRIIADNISNENLYVNDGVLYFMKENYDELNVYEITTGEISISNIDWKDACSLRIIGPYEYFGNVTNTSSITIERSLITSKDKTSKKIFIKFPFKQKNKLDYSTSINQINEYYLVHVQTTDFNDNSYGWRGKFMGIKWYVANKKGKIIATFS